VLAFGESTMKACSRLPRLTGSLVSWGRFIRFRVICAAT
jgi:hypothetical protein